MQTKVLTVPQKFILLKTDNLFIHSNFPISLFRKNKFLNEQCGQMAASILYILYICWQQSVTVFNHLYCFCKDKDTYKSCKTLAKTCGVHVIIVFPGYEFYHNLFRNTSVFVVYKFVWKNTFIFQQPNFICPPLYLHQVSAQK